MPIRVLAPAEVELILPMVLHVHGLHSDAQPARYVRDPEPEAVLDWLCDWMSGPDITALIHEEGGRRCGYLVFEVDQSASRCPLIPPKNLVRLEHICVLPAFQRKGIGRALITDMRSRARQQGITRAVVSYGMFNKASAGLMARMGFVPHSCTGEAAI